MTSVNGTRPSYSRSLSNVCSGRGSTGLASSNSGAEAKVNGYANDEY